MVIFTVIRNPKQSRSINFTEKMSKDVKFRKLSLQKLRLTLWWWKENNRNVGVVVVEGQQLKCGDGGLGGRRLISMQEGRKLVCRKTLIHINKGKAYRRQGKAPTGLILLKHDYLANQNYLRCLFFLLCKFFICGKTADSLT